jgi:hypothetical protein
MELGNWTYWSKPITESSWTHTKLYRSSTEAGAYSEIVQQAIADTTYYDESGISSDWYKYSYYNNGSLVESEQSDAFPATRTTVTYCQPDDVAQYLQVFNSQSFVGFDGNTKPTVFQILQLISQNEDAIDRETNHAWRVRYSGTETNEATAATYEYYDAPEIYDTTEGAKIFLNHRKIRTLAAGSGDALEVWDGDSYTDYIASKTEGRASDWWMDYDRGVLYIYDIPSTYKRAVRIKYRYGDTYVPKDIERACTLMTAMDAIMSDDRSVILPTGTDNIGLGSKVELMRKEADRIMKNRAEIRYMKRN